MGTLNFNLAGRVRIGQADSSLPALFQITGDSNAAAEIQQWQFSNDSAAPTHDFRKARGTYAAPADAQIGDRIIDIRGLPRSSAVAGAPGFVFAGGAVRSYVDGPGPLVSGQNPPSRVMIETNLQNAASQEQIGVFSNGFMAVGFSLCAAGVAQVAGLLHVAGNGVTEQYLQRSSADATAAEFRLRKSRGTIAAPANVVQDDMIAYIVGRSYSNAWVESASIRYFVDAAVVAGQVPASRIVFYTNANNAAPVAAAAIWNTQFMGVGPDQVAAGSAATIGLLHVGGNGTTVQYLQRSSADANGPEFRIRKSRGTIAAPADVVLNDVIGMIFGRAYSAAFVESASIRYAVDAAVTSGQVPASRIEYWTGPNNGGTAVQAVLHSDGNNYWGDKMAALALNPTGMPSDGHLFGAESARHLYLIRASTSNGFNIGFHRSRGTLAAQANVVDGDRTVRVESNQWSGATGYWAGARMDMSVDGAVVDNQRPGSNIHFYTNAPNTAVALRVEFTGAGNVGIFTQSYGASSVGVVGIGNATTVPTGNPAGGGVLYAQAGALKWRGSGGTTTTIAAA